MNVIPVREFRHMRWQDIVESIHKHGPIQFMYCYRGGWRRSALVLYDWREHEKYPSLWLNDIQYGMSKWCGRDWKILIRGKLPKFSLLRVDDSHQAVPDERDEVLDRLFNR